MDTGYGLNLRPKVIRGTLNAILSGVLLLSVTGGAAVGSADEVAPPPHGRISFDGGGMLVRGLNDSDWARASINTLALPGDTLWVDEGGASELEFAGGTYLRMADASKLELVALTPSFQFRGWVGSFYVQRLVGAPGQCLMQTPACTVEIFADSAARIDIAQNGGVTVTVRWGSAEVRTDNGGAVRVSQGYRVWIDPGLLPSDPVAFDRNQSDAFDKWNADRAELLANGVKTLPREIPVVSAIGAAELAANGTWVYIDNRPYWRSVVVDYVPFRYGYWNYVPVVGHVWVGAYPFCYVTAHYGRWRYVSAYGWVWTYDPVWSPAWAVTVSVGDRFLWVPCDFYARPVLVADTAVFSVGSLTFSLSAVSWMPATYVTTGCAVVYPATPVIVDVVRTVPATQVNIWNIYVNPTYQRRIPRPVYPADSIRVRDYNPSRSIRGVPQTLLAENTAPAARAQTLESRIARSTFQPVMTERAAVDGGNRAVRTGLPSARNSMAGTPRSVRLSGDLTADAPSGGIDRRIRTQMARADYGNIGNTARTSGAGDARAGAIRDRAVLPETAVAGRTSGAADSKAVPRQAYAVRTPRGGGASPALPAERRAPNRESVPTLNNRIPHAPLVNIDRSGGGETLPPRSVGAESLNREPVSAVRDSAHIRSQLQEISNSRPSQTAPRESVSAPDSLRTSPSDAFSPRVAVRDMEPASPMLPGRSRGSSSGTSTPRTPPSRPSSGSNRQTDTTRPRTTTPTRPATRSFGFDLPSLSAPRSGIGESRTNSLSGTSLPSVTENRSSVSGLSEVGRLRPPVTSRIPSFTPEISRGGGSVESPRVDALRVNTPRVEMPRHQSSVQIPVGVSGGSRPSGGFSPRVAPVRAPSMPSVRNSNSGGFSRMR